MLEIRCDFCNEKITTKQNKGGKAKKFRLEQNICNDCKNKDLNKTWEDKIEKTNKQWDRIKAEKEKFFRSVLKTQKRDWFEIQRKEHFGSFYVEENKR